MDYPFGWGQDRPRQSYLKASIPAAPAAPLTLWLARRASAGEQELFFAARHESPARDETLPLRPGQLLILGSQGMRSVAGDAFEMVAIEEAGERWVRLRRPLSHSRAPGEPVGRWADLTPALPLASEGCQGIAPAPSLRVEYDGVAPAPPLRLEFSGFVGDSFTERALDSLRFPRRGD